MRLREGVNSDADAQFLLDAITASAPLASEMHREDLFVEVTCGSAMLLGLGDPYVVGVIVRDDGSGTAILSNLYSKLDRNSTAIWWFLKRVVQYLKRMGYTSLLLAVTHDQPKAVRTMKFYKNRLNFELHGVILGATIDEVERAWAGFSKG